MQPTDPYVPESLNLPLDLRALLENLSDRLRSQHVHNIFCPPFLAKPTARTPRLNCGKHCDVQCASTRMLAHLGYYSDETLIVARRGASCHLHRFDGACPHRTLIATSMRSQRDPHHDAGLSPSDDDQMAARRVGNRAHRKASGRATHPQAAWRAIVAKQRKLPG